MISIIYYAHSLNLYNTIQESDELRLLQEYFRKGCIYNPNRPYIQRHSDPMAACLDVVKECQGLAFSTHRGRVTSGVLLEVKTAQKHDIPVYKIDGAIYEFEGRLISKKRRK